MKLEHREPIIWRTQYDSPRDEAERAETDILCEDDSLTIQDAPDTDINTLVARFGIKDGSILPATLGQPVDARYYGDFTFAPADLREAIERTREAELRFNELPAAVRAKFQNNPASLVTWLVDDRNRTEAEELGLITKRPVKTDPGGSGDPPKT